MSVYFKCKNCEAEHKSAVAFTDRVSFEAWPMPESEIRCHTTGRTATYTKVDMYWGAERTPWQRAVSDQFRPFFR